RPQAGRRCDGPGVLGSPVDGLNYLFLGWNGRTLGRAAERDSLSAVAWLIPYCARHHPLQSETQRVPGTLSASFSQGASGWAGLHCARPPSTPSAHARNESILSARCASTTGSPAAPPLFPVCATREHGGSAWPPRP